MAQLRVKVTLLNRRTAIPQSFPEYATILGQVPRGYEFKGVEVQDVPNPALGSWYRSSEGYYFWGGGLEVVTTGLDWWLNDLRISDIWNCGEFGDLARVAVLDSGYNTQLPDLAGSVKQSAVFCAPADTSIEDTYGHGTFCATLVGGRNKLNTVGVAPACELFIGKTYRNGSIATWDPVRKAIQWAIDNDVDVISYSAGSQFEDNDVAALINTAMKKHIVFVASIGNRTDNGEPVPEFPAKLDDCLAVGATDKAGKISAITVPFEKTFINAPGEEIRGYWLDNEIHKVNNGTSQATAITAGVCALLISAYKKKNNNNRPPLPLLKKLISDNSSPITNTNQKLIAPSFIYNKI